tara:strand:+ start:2444 stop:3610 length:1167 start_codon:yes stop_codon:yes gene_type:complete
MKEKKIIYLVVGENPLSGIFKTQLYKSYQDLEIFSSIKIIFLINPFLWFRIRKDVVVMQEFMKDVTIHIVPLQLIPERYMRLGIFFTKFGNLWNLFIFRLLKIIGFLTSDIIVARSYYAGYVLSKLKLSNSFRVFDPRSIYPLERYSHGYLKSLRVYDFWLSWEGNFINRFDSVISVSRGMTEYYKKFNSKVAEIFLNSGIKVRSVSIRPVISKNLHLVYWGSLVYKSHNNSWMHYKRRLKELESIVNIPIEVDFFVPYIDIRIKDIKYCGKIKVNFFQGLKSMDITKYHASIYFIPESLDTFSRLGIKTVEYLSQNLPIIFDKGMSNFVIQLLIKNNAGFNINDFKFESLNFIGNNPLRVYQENFTSDISNRNLKKLYESFSSTGKP